MTRHCLITLITVSAFLLTACSDTSDNNGDADPGFDPVALLTTLASDELMGRDNLTPDSVRVQELLVEQLSQFAEPVYPDREGIAGYQQEFDVGTNIMALVPGGELADEYVMIGAHYDHLAECADATPDDMICNGAGDNAAGVAAVFDIVRDIIESGVPRRSIIIALWDTEEDGLIGARRYVASPIFPLEQTIAYVNFDILGANLLPSLQTYTILVGAETGGPNLQAAAREARKASNLNTVMLSLLFGQGRSDHAALEEGGVPAVFFTDANNGCYHTVKDDIDAVDLGKFEQQILAANALTRDLLATDAVPEFDADAPVASYQDAVELLTIVQAAEVDFGRFPPDEQVTAEQYLLDLRNIVDAGQDAFGTAAITTLLLGAGELVTSLAGQDCDPFLPEE